MLRSPATAADTLPVRGFEKLFRGYHAISFDPDRVRLLRTVGDTRIYLVPATIAPVGLPSACANIPRLAGIGAFVRYHNLAAGSGPGVCVFTAVRSPGDSTPQPSSTGCASLATLNSYYGTPTSVQVNADTYAVFPDGVNTFQYTLPDGHVKTFAVTGNLALVHAGIRNVTGKHGVAKVVAELESQLPVSEREISTSGYAIASFTEPRGFTALIVKSITFAYRVLSSVTSQSSSGSESCGAHSRVCTATTVTTACTSKHHCSSQTTTSTTTTADRTRTRTRTHSH